MACSACAWLQRCMMKAQVQGTDAPERGMTQTLKFQGLCGPIASPKTDLQGQDLQAWHCCTATELLVSIKLLLGEGS